MSACFLRIIILLLTVVSAMASADENPLHRRINQLLPTTAAPADDATFLRRVFLDLAGRIPSVTEAKQFLNDTSPERRKQLIDRLLDSRDYPRRMQEAFHIMLLERRGDHQEWSRFLRDSFEQNRPWDEMVRLLLKPAADDESARGAAWFQTSRLVKEGAMADVDVPGLTRDVGRLLAGVDLGCAQCHDDLVISDYLQQDFQGLQMVFENVVVRTDVGFPAVGEKLLTAPREFSSVFEQIPRQTVIRVPGAAEVALQTFAEGEEYTVPPDRKSKFPGEPKFSPLQQVAEHLTARENRLFAANLVNRVWFLMLGKGLVWPLDMHHSGNPSQHPQLHDLLAQEFAAHDFDLKWLLREIALTDAYQSDSTPSDPSVPVSVAELSEKRISAESLFWSVLIALEQLDPSDTERSLEQQLAESQPLQELQKQFLKVFANAPKEPELLFEPTVAAALFVMHDEQVLGLLDAESSPLPGRLSQLEDAAEVVQQASLQIYSRPATEVETAELVELLQTAAADQRSETISQLIWAMLASTEFCVNH